MPQAWRFGRNYGQFFGSCEGLLALVRSSYSGVSRSETGTMLLLCLVSSLISKSTKANFWKPVQQKRRNQKKNFTEIADTLFIRAPNCFSETFVCCPKIDYFILLCINFQRNRNQPDVIKSTPWCDFSILYISCLIGITWFAWRLFWLRARFTK